MMPAPDLSMSERLAWAQWWAFPWKSAHEDWRAADKHPAINALYRTGVLATSTLAGIAPCLPPAPHPAVLRLVLASTEQRNLLLALIHSTFSPASAAPLSEEHQQWCTRLSKALPPDMLLPHDDPLQLLRSWVKPATWQRLRLRFPYERVLEMEKRTLSFENGHSRLNTLWQAVVWRITATTHDHLPPDRQGDQ
ncbi:MULTISPECIES: type III secretion protein [unclassified Pseudomonas]|uniref:type III secretion protein n=1 Tax=unclassified Pseudomonas TaxID=196821 RepID=UPI0015A32188|nr:MULTISPECIES: type III secretion protein [unclassified Pseudomonas]NWC93855.1 type III secretion protein [Pseudomonas sp. IPO3779]NWD16171.1 type III secretion protein [Pseudomonas sp. IPO3778]